MQNSGKDLWGINPFLFGILMLPAIGLITASFLVDENSLTDDGYPLDTFLLALGGFFFLIDTSLIMFFALNNTRKKYLIEHGLNGKARVLQIQETGTRINGIPRYKLLLEVNDGYNPVRTLSVSQLIPLHKLHFLKVNEEISVKVHPRKPGKVLVILE